MSPADDIHAAIDDFVASSRALNGQECNERPSWNTAASADAIRHFALGTCDLNPIWTDPAYAAQTQHGRLRAPPAFLISVLYPVLHGARVWVPLANLIGDLGFEWYRPICEGDRLRGTARQTDVREGHRRGGQRLVCIGAEVTYRNQREEIVARATSTLLWIDHGTQALVTRGVHRYHPDEIEALTHAMRAEERRGARGFAPDEIALGKEIPAVLRAPLTLADLICWQAAAGPAQRPGTLGAIDAAASPHTAVVHPLTGWLVKSSLQHEDVHLTQMRGMPVPFDNGAMRFAWLAPLLTNWIGDHGVLERLHVRFKEPVLYGDLSRYRATITRRVDTAAGARLQLRIQAVNQLGMTTTAGEAEVLLPPEAFAQNCRAAARLQRQTPAASVSQPLAPVPRGSLGAGVSIAALVAAQVRRTPDAPAVCCGAAVLPYGELDRRANRLAHRLRRLGVGPRTRVAMLLERTPRAVVASLAIAKSGATRVSLDPAYTGERLGALLEAVNATVLLLDPGCSAPASAALPGRVQMLALESDALESDALDDEVDGDFDGGPGGEDLAYVMFTSGTLRAPKAVAVSYASLGLSVRAVGATLGIASDDRYLHSASFAFSASERQLWLPLCAGATVVLAESADRSDPLALLRTIRARAVTVWDTVPSWLRWCMDRLDALAPAQREALLGERLRRVLLTGEALPWELAERWMRRLGQRARIVNLYSQTETVGTTCCFPVDALPADLAGTVPLGKPVSGASIHVLDAALNPVPTGAVGEICVGGERLAWGYLGHPELDAVRFVADPFAAGAGARLYRTGDLGRMQPDGNLAYVGRADDRIKMRGFRVEPADIEAALMAYPQVREAVVTADDAGTRLVAYLVADGQPLAPDAVRHFLGTRLPAYMVPASYVVMDRLPRTASGKVDRTMLPLPSAERPDLVHPAAVPIDALEQQLAEVWARVLGLESIGVEDDFFDLGGDSLLAVSVVVESERRLGRALVLDWLYDASTVRAFAQRAQFPPVSGDARCVFALRQGSAAAALFFVSGGGGYLFTFQRLAELLGGDAPSYGLQLPGLNDERRPLDRVEAIASEFVDQIRSVQATGPYHLVGYSFGGLVVYEMARQLTAAGERVGLLGLLDTPGPGAFRPKPMAQRFTVHVSRLAALSAAARLRYVGALIARQSRRWSGTPPRRPDAAPGDPAGSPTERRRQAVRRAQRNARRAYARPPYAGRVWLFRSEPEEWMRLVTIDPTYGWSALCAGNVTVHEVAGQHGTLLDEPHVHVLATALRATLAAIAESTVV